MRRFFFILLFTFVGLIGIMAILPLFFKNSMSEQLKTEINKNIEGKIDFSEFHISLFNQFPKVELQVLGLNITGINEFSKDTLVSINELTGIITLAELFSDKELKITHVHASGTNLLLKTIEGGAANWNIVPAGKSEVQVTKKSATDSENGMKIMLDQLELDHFNLKYVDVPSSMVFAINNLSTQSTGKIAGTQMNFDIQAEVEEMSFEYNSVKYISNTRLRAKSKVLFNTEDMSFQFSEGNVWLNDLLLKLEGSFSIPSDSMYFDLQLSNDSKDFKALLALIPTNYQNYLEKIQTDGSATISANIKGWYYADNYPAFQLQTEISNGTFQYADLSEKIDQINLKASVSKPQGDLDQLEVDISDASASLRNIPIHANLKITHPISDPQYTASLNGKIDFDILNKAIPMEGTDLQGKLTADISLQGKQSDIDNKTYDKFKSEGKINLSDFVYRSEILKQPVNIKSAIVSVTTPKIEIKNLNGNIGESHFSVTGTLQEYLPYFLKDGILKGEFDLNSDFVSLTELANIQNQLTIQKADSSIVQNSKIEADSILAFEIPEKIDLKFRSAIKRAKFDRMELSQINGLITIQNKSLELHSLDMNMLQGKLTINGTYSCDKQLHPDFNFNVNASNFDVQSAYQSLSIIRRYLPIASHSQGKISAQLIMSGKMNEKLEMIPPTLNGSGTFSTQGLMVVDNPTFKQLKGIIKSEKLKNVKVDDFSAHLDIENGNLLVKPFNTKIADQETTVQGKVSVDSQLDFALDFKLNREDLGADINKGLDLLPGSENIQKINTGVKITGTLKKPEVSVDLDSTRKQVMEEIKKASVKEIQDKAKKIGNELKKLFK